MASQRHAVVQHHGITCDNCNEEPIRGIRYKCINCPDYDLCRHCEDLQVHDPSHVFLKIRSPQLQGRQFPFVPVPATRDNASLFLFPDKPQAAPLPVATTPEYGSATPIEYPNTTIPSTDIVDSINRFGFQLLSFTTTGKEPNGVAPSNIYHCAMMAAAGTKGRTLEAFGKSLGFNHTEILATIQEVLSLDSYCKSQPSNGGSEVELTSAASVWHSPFMVLEEKWSELMKTGFKAKFGPMSPIEINRWVARETKGRITNLVSQPPAGPLLLVTCLYFKGKWKDPFRESETRPALFRTFNDTFVNCSMMHRIDNMAYYEDDTAQMCVLPYINAPGSPPTAPIWKVAVILPKTKGPEALSQIVFHLSSSPSTLRSLLAAPKQQYVNLSLPRFTLKIDLDLTEPLEKEMGLAPAFKTCTDFDPLSRTRPVFITKVTHNLFVEVNEQGTEVAAATSISLFGGSASQPILMSVDRPFLFLVFDERSMLVLCSAVVNSV